MEEALDELVDEVVDVVMEDDVELVADVWVEDIEEVLLILLVEPVGVVVVVEGFDDEEEVDVAEDEALPVTLCEEVVEVNIVVEEGAALKPAAKK